MIYQSATAEMLYKITGYTSYQDFHAETIAFCDLFDVVGSSTYDDRLSQWGCTVDLVSTPEATLSHKQF